jgi:prophage regulatory protein
MQADTVPRSTAQSVPVHFLRLPAVCARIGLSRSHIHRLEAAGKFPARVKLSPAASAWIESEIDAWAAARVAASRGGDA